jgi:hydrogenase maturation protease
MHATPPGVLILGIGNLLWADEGFGVRAVEYLHRHWSFGDHVRLADGGTQGIYLVQDIRDAQMLVVFDAVDYGLPAATLKLVEGDDVPSFLGAKKVSLHQTGFQEVLAMAEMMGEAPSQLLLVGVQPEEIEDFGGSLRASVKAQMEPAIEAALNWLAERGVHAARRAVPLAPEQGLGCLEMVIERYEEERPDDAAAPRLGDARVLEGEQWAGPVSAEAHEAQLRDLLGGPNLRVML